MKEKRRGGAPRKAPDGLNRSLYVRVTDRHLQKLERLRARRSEQHRLTLSVADVVRQLIDEAMR